MSIKITGVKMSGLNLIVAPPTVKQAQSLLNSTGTNVTITYPRPIQKDNLLIVFASAQQNNPPTMDASWTQFSFSYIGVVPCTGWWKIAGELESQAHNVNYPGTSNRTLVWYEIADVDVADPFYQIVTYRASSPSGNSITFGASGGSSALWDGEAKALALPFVTVSGTQSGWAVNNSFTNVQASNSWSSWARRTYTSKQLNETVTFSWASLAVNRQGIMPLIKPKRYLTGL